MVRNILISLAVLSLLVFSACSGSQPAPQPLQEAAPSQAAPVQSTPVVAEEPTDYTLEAYKFGFEPAELRVKQGERVRLALTSREGAHGISIPAFGVSSETFSETEPKTVEFTADKTGEFPVMCSVFCGQGHASMKSKLIVE